jgi:hypothetical protein
MSAYREQKTEITDGDCLVDALKELGCKPEVHEEAVALEGYHGDKRKDKAEIVLPRNTVGSASNDIGFKKGADGKWQAIISDYDSNKYNKKWMEKLCQTYATHKIKKIARQQDLEFQGTSTNKDGKVVHRYVKA